MSSTEVRPPPRLVLLRGGRDVERELSRQEADWADFCDRIGWQSPSVPPLEPSALEDGELEQRLIAGIERRLAQPPSGESGEACEGQGEDAPIQEPPRRLRRARFGVAALAVAALLGAAAATVVAWLARPSDLPLPTRDAADVRPVAPRSSAPLFERTPEPAPSSAPREELVEPAPMHRTPPRLGPPRVTPPGARELARTDAHDRVETSTPAVLQVLARTDDVAAIRVAPALADAVPLGAVGAERVLPSRFTFERPADLLEGASSLAVSARPVSALRVSASPGWLASNALDSSLARSASALGGVSPAHFEASDAAVSASPLPRPAPFSLAPSRRRWIGASTPPSDPSGDRPGSIGVMAQLDLGGALQL